MTYMIVTIDIDGFICFSENELEPISVGARTRCEQGEKL